MKQRTSFISAWIVVFALILAMIPTAYAATYEYAVEGGKLKFDPATGTITDCDTSVYSAVIPREINGVPVTTIGKYAFQSCKKLKKVEIPDSVTCIDGSAFHACTALTSVTVPSSVTSFGQYVFASCYNLETAVIPGSVKELPKNTFASCEALKSVTLGEGITSIDYWALGGCDKLEELILPDTVTYIAKQAVSGCDNLKTVTFGKSIKHIESKAFFNCPLLSVAKFRGNAPQAEDSIFEKYASDFTIYYPDGASGWTTPTWNGYITKSYTMPGATNPPTQASSGMVTAVPAYSPVYVNGVQIQFDAYNINKNNYFKLRDLAFVLSGTEAQFNVEWKNAVAMTSGQPYIPVGGEMAEGNGINKIAKPTTSAVLLNGSPIELTAYNINQNNYFKLRDIGKLFNFGVRWDSARQAVVIQTDEPYVDG